MAFQRQKREKNQDQKNRKSLTIVQPNLAKARIDRKQGQVCNSWNLKNQIISFTERKATG